MVVIDKKSSPKDFTLITEKTKLRIKGLIEKKLTTQTIALFAQEYELYEPAIRSEIMEFILFLISKEEAEIKSKDTQHLDTRTRLLLEMRKMEFSEKKSNIKKIQEVLIKKEVDEERKKAAKLAAEKAKLNKPETPKINNKLEKMLREARERELQREKEEKLEKQKKEKEALLKKEAAKKLAEQKRKENQKKREELQKNKANNSNIKDKNSSNELKTLNKDNKAGFVEKKTSSTTTKAKNDNKKPLSYEEKLFAAKNNQFTPVERDYEKEQKEKEKLWKELYGNPRDQKSGDKPTTTSKETWIKEIDKTPTIEELVLEDYSLYGHRYPIDELINPINKYYIFWNSIKNKYHVSNITSWLKETTPKMHKKLWKKRKKLQKKVDKNRGVPKKAAPNKSNNKVETKKSQKQD